MKMTVMQSYLEFLEQSHKSWKVIWRTRDMRKKWRLSDHNTVEIGSNTEKSSGKLRDLLLLGLHWKPPTGTDVLNPKE